MDRPILFSTPMIRAVLDGRKTQTRRLAWRLYRKGESSAEGDRIEILTPPDVVPGKARSLKPTLWQKVEPGDRLWVRETWNFVSRIPEEAPDQFGFRRDGQKIVFAADFNAVAMPWRPSIHMPRWASRLTLVVIEIRRQKVQEISIADAIGEGIDLGVCSTDGRALLTDGRMCPPSVRQGWITLWDSLHKPGNRWEDNPEVVAITYTVHQTNIDKMEQAA